MTQRYNQFSPYYFGYSPEVDADRKPSRGEIEAEFAD